MLLHQVGDINFGEFEITPASCMLYVRRLYIGHGTPHQNAARMFQAYLQRFHVYVAYMQCYLEVYVR